jgi:6-pyruvoyltetrahydropterin/6-carboxytetrahydropterin synthase
MMENPFRTVEFYKGKLKFSAGHFTIFSATERECLHGHNYELEASFTAEISEPGLTFDYRIFDTQLLKLCKQLDFRFLLPQHSPYLKIEEDADYYIAEFNHKKLFFLKEDALVLPLSNITLEELSSWFVEHMIKDQAFIESHRICEIWIKVFNGPEHCAKAQWKRD